MADHFSSSVGTSGARENPSTSSNPPQHLSHFWIHEPIITSTSRPISKDDPIRSPHSLKHFLNFTSLELPNQFDWTSVNIQIDRSLSRLDNFIRRQYLDDENDLSDILKFSYSRPFLHWLLSSPGSQTFLHVGIRDKATKKLAGFIACTPVNIRIRRRNRRVAITNLLCIHQNHRSTRLVPLLVKEVARRATVYDIWTGLFATEALLASPSCSCIWFRRYLNAKKLFKIGYKVKLETKRKRGIGDKINIPPKPETAGFRKMQRRDIGAVTYLLKNYLKKFKIAPIVDDYFVKHYLLPKRGIVESYVVEDLNTNVITDFCSFVIQKKEVRKKRRWWVVKSAVLFYYAAVSNSPVELVRDLVSIARNKEFDIFRAQGIMGNNLFLPMLRFEADEDIKKLNFYFYNYALSTVLTPEQFGVVIL